ncbi:MAG: hypothetical protein F4Z25_01910 [Chloroflexi bacterium]|nr:hypothetical protein [Chloroflexota bacterium]
MRRPLSVDERAERLLRYLSNRPVPLGESVAVSRNTLLAWTESTEIREVIYLEEYLLSCGWITGRTLSGPNILITTVTVDGHRQIADQVANSESAQVFVAMWFDASTDFAYSQGVEPAIRDAGYQPLRIDRKEHNNKIEDEIVAEIRRSRFVVADFTQGDDGARGGVYYEAGFAHGLDLPVILTCHEDRFDQVHFDTNHYNHIVWSTPAELREKLRIRILAVIGEGPEVERGN